MTTKKEDKRRWDDWGIFRWTFWLGWFMSAIGFNYFLQPVSTFNIILLISLISGLSIVIYSTYRAEIVYRQRIRKLEKD